MHYYLISTKDNQREVMLNCNSIETAMTVAADLLMTTIDELASLYNENDINEDLIGVMQRENRSPYNIGYLDSKIHGFTSQLDIGRLMCCEYIPYQTREEKIDKFLT